MGLDFSKEDELMAVQKKLMMTEKAMITSGHLHSVATPPERSVASASVSIHSHLGFQAAILLAHVILYFAIQYILCILIYIILYNPKSLVSAGRCQKILGFFGKLRTA